MNRKNHWERIYKTRSPTQVSWYQKRPTKSLALIRQAGVGIDAALIDVGGGASTLINHLLDQGYRRLTVLDISGEALDTSKRRLGRRAKNVTWIESDVTTARLPKAAYDIWHDRAVFHFLTNARDRKRYKSALARALKPEGHFIIATFAADGPLKCSGLAVRRYSVDNLQKEFGAQYKLLKSVNEAHHTPFETQQKFTYCCFQKVK